MKTSGAADGKKQLRQNPGRPRQNQSDAADGAARITAPRQLADLRRWVEELHTTHGYSYRRIAEHTSRGRGTHGYWQLVAAGAHQGPHPRIRPTVQDYQDLRQLARLVRELGLDDRELLDAVLVVVDRQAELVRAVADCLALVQRRQRRKECR